MASLIEKGLFCTMCEPEIFLSERSINHESKHFNTKEDKRIDIIMKGNREQTKGESRFKQLVKKRIVLLHGQCTGQVIIGDTVVIF